LTVPGQRLFAKTRQPAVGKAGFKAMEALINEDFCPQARRERFLSGGILKIFRALKNVSNEAWGQKDH
jgi:hypothetical protein